MGVSTVRPGDTAQNGCASDLRSGPDHVSPLDGPGNYTIAQSEVRQTEGHGQTLGCMGLLVGSYEMCQPGRKKQDHHEEKAVAWNQREEELRRLQWSVQGHRTCGAWDVSRGLRNREAIAGLGQSSLPGVVVGVGPQCKG